VDRPRERNSRLLISAFLCFIISPIVGDICFMSTNHMLRRSIDGPLLVPKKATAYHNRKVASRRVPRVHYFKLNVAHNITLIFISILHFLLTFSINFPSTSFFNVRYKTF
jgi:hypothetical protein